MNDKLVTYFGFIQYYTQSVEEIDFNISKISKLSCSELDDLNTVEKVDCATCYQAAKSIVEIHLDENEEGQNAEFEVWIAERREPIRWESYIVKRVLDIKAAGPSLEEAMERSREQV